MGIEPGMHVRDSVSDPDSTLKTGHDPKGGRDLLFLERELWALWKVRVAGVDEAGRGPLAGPVVAAAVVLPPDLVLPGIDDSKRLTPVRREEFFERIMNCAVGVGVGIESEAVVDEINILQATFRAMRSAIGKLDVPPECVLVDGWAILDLAWPQKAIIQGDRKSQCIAAASIIAKVTRDRIMVGYDRVYPMYGFARHKGYGTRRHVEAIQKHGLCPIHRRTFHVGGWCAP
jgi:ribonuclease HII